jgi:hypothetical protein
VPVIHRSPVVPRPPPTRVTKATRHLIRFARASGRVLASIAPRSLPGFRGAAVLSVTLLALIVRGQSAGATAHIAGPQSTPGAATRVITTIAGDGTAGYSGDGGPATAANLNAPLGVAVDSSGNVYVVDSKNSVVRKITASSGVITTIAGDGTAGYSGDGGPATSAQLNSPWGVAVDGADNVYIADTGNHVIREVAAATGVISTVAGRGGWDGYDVVDGGPATSSSFNDPTGVAVDSSGNLYITEACPNVNAVFEVPDANVTQFGQKMTAGDIYTIAGDGIWGPTSWGYSGDGGPATSAKLEDPMGVAVDAAGDVYIADTSNSVVREVVASTGVITTIAGDGTYGYSVDGGFGNGGPATAAELADPYGVAVDADGNVYIADTYNSVVREVSAATGVITTIAGDGTEGLSGDGGAATGATISVPAGLAVSSSGTVYIADFGNDVIRKVTVAAVAPRSTAPTLVTPLPRITGLMLSHTTFRRGTSRARVSRQTPVGTVVSFALSEDAAVIFSFARVTTGRFSDGVCVTATASRRGLPACTRLRAVAGAVPSSSLTAGTHHMSLDGVLASDAVMPLGTYRLTLVARNAAGQSAPVSTRFTLKH